MLPLTGELENSLRAWLRAKTIEEKEMDNFKRASLCLDDAKVNLKSAAEIVGKVCILTEGQERHLKIDDQVIRVKLYGRDKEISVLIVEGY